MYYIIIDIFFKAMSQMLSNIFLFIFTIIRSNFLISRRQNKSQKC